jgi:methyl-accepting chemotaxis protein
VKVAEHSGRLLNELVPSVQKAADIVQEVSAASGEQAQGVSQVNRAMGQVDQATQRNASAAEELSSTAEELAAQAESLEQLMGFFRLPEAGRDPRRVTERNRNGRLPAPAHVLATADLRQGGRPAPAAEPAGSWHSS